MPLTWRFVQNWLSLNPLVLDPIGCLISAADKKTPASEGSGLFSRQLPWQGNALSLAKLISAVRDLFFGVGMSAFGGKADIAFRARHVRR